MELLNRHKTELDRACQNHKVNELYAFGSILTDQFNSSSDIDFVVSIDSDDPLEYGEHYFDLKFELERIFRRKIDLLEQKAVKNELFKDLINKQKMLIYAKRNQSLA